MAKNSPYISKFGPRKFISLQILFLVKNWIRISSKNNSEKNWDEKSAIEGLASVVFKSRTLAGLSTVGGWHFRPNPLFSLSA
jgi:hypothetical protein